LMGLAQAKLLIEAPVNGGRNNNGRHSRGLRPEAFTSNFHLSALVTCHSLYIVLRLCRELCFC